MNRWDIVAAAIMLALMLGAPLLVFSLELPAGAGKNTLAASRDIDHRQED